MSGIISVGPDETSGIIGAFPVGHILNIQQVTSTATSSTTNGSFLVPVSLAITMTNIQSTTSKFMCVAHINTSSPAGANAGGGFALANGGTVIAGATGDAASNRTRITSQAALGANTWRMFTRGFSYIDSPASVSDQTYEIRWRAQGSTTYLNQAADDGDNADRVRGMSSLIVMEIA